MTQDELKVIERTCDVVNAFASLPVYHIADAKDVAFHIHAIQAIVMQRDAVRLHPDVFRCEQSESLVERINEAKKEIYELINDRMNKK